MPRWVAARRSLQNLQPLGPDQEHFHLEQQVERELRRMEPETSPHRSSSSAQALAPSAPLSGAVVPAERYGCSRLMDMMKCRARCFCKLCGLLALLCFPFRAPLDNEDDDEEFAVDTLARVRVHLGFTETYDSVRGEVIDLLQERLSSCRSEGRPVEIYVAGHSLGGALASLFALDVVDLLAAEEEWPIDSPSGAEKEWGLDSGHVDSRPRTSQPAVYTFGSPRIGNAAFRSIYNVLVPDTFRVVASRDLVPAVPPSITYRQLGREVWVSDAGELTFLMSWAMRHILPGRDNAQCHLMGFYYTVLGKAFRGAAGARYSSVFNRSHEAVREALEPREAAEAATAGK